jgi:hypothetical protein
VPGVRPALRLLTAQPEPLLSEQEPVPPERVLLPEQPKLRGRQEPGFQPREPEPWGLPGPARAPDG